MIKLDKLKIENAGDRADLSTKDVSVLRKRVASMKDPKEMFNMIIYELKPYFLVEQFISGLGHGHMGIMRDSRSSKAELLWFNNLINRFGGFDRLREALLNSIECLEEYCSQNNLDIDTHVTILSLMSEIRTDIQNQVCISEKSSSENDAPNDKLNNLLVLSGASTPRVLRRNNLEGLATLLNRYNNELDGPEILSRISRRIAYLNNNQSDKRRLITEFEMDQKTVDARSDAFELIGIWTGFLMALPSLYLGFEASMRLKTDSDLNTLIMMTITLCGAVLPSLLASYHRQELAKSRTTIAKNNLKKIESKELIRQYPGENDEQFKARERIFSSMENNALEIAIELTNVIKSQKVKSLNFEMSDVVNFYSYYKVIASEANREKIKDLLNNPENRPNSFNMGNFMKIYQLMNLDIGYGEKITEFLARHDWKYITDIAGALDIKNTIGLLVDSLIFSKKLRNKVSKEIIQSIIEKRIIRFIDRLLENKEAPDVIIKNFSQDTLIWGAMFAGIQTAIGSDEFERLEKILIDTKIETFNGGENVALQITNSNEFREIEEVIDNTYKDNKEYANDVKKEIRNDLKSVENQFFMLKKDNEILGIIKLKKDFPEKGDFYLGSLYVRENFQQGFNLGKFLTQAALSAVPKGYQVHASVKVGNPAIVAHFKNMDLVAVGIHDYQITSDGMKETASDFRLIINPRNENLVSKNEYNLSDQAITASINVGYISYLGKKIIIKKMPISKDVLNKYFENGFVITRAIGTEQGEVVLCFEKR